MLDAEVTQRNRNLLTPRSLGDPLDLRNLLKKFFVEN
jgi:hypothetical protein